MELSGLIFFQEYSMVYSLTDNSWFSSGVAYHPFIVSVDSEIIFFK